MKGFSSVQQEISISEIYHNKSQRWIFPFLMGAGWFWLGLSYPENSGTLQIMAFVTSMASIIMSILTVTKHFNYLKIHENGIEIKNGYRKHFISWDNISHFGVWKRTWFGLPFGEFVGFDVKDVGFDVKDNELKQSFVKKKTGFDGLLPGYYGFSAPAFAGALVDFHNNHNLENTN